MGASPSSDSGKEALGKGIHRMFLVGRGKYRNYQLLRNLLRQLCLPVHGLDASVKHTDAFADLFLGPAKISDVNTGDVL